MKPYFDDVLAFHKKFVLPTHETVTLRTLPADLHKFRTDFMQEELDEYVEGHNEGNLQKQIDAIVDLIYVALGTAIKMGVPPAMFQCYWNSVQDANMNKVLAKDLADSQARTGRGHPMDVVKPDGWVSPTARQLELIDGEFKRIESGLPEK